MTVLFIVLGNIILTYGLFLIFSKKLVLPKSCFYREGLIILASSTCFSLILSPFSKDGFFFIAYLLTFILTFICVNLGSYLRDPERKFGGDDRIILSPADGRVIYIRKAEKGVVPVSIKGKNRILLNEITKTEISGRDCWLIGITMSILDVHVNRAPIAGKITLNQYIRGKFLSLKSPDSETENERNTIVIESKGCLIGVIQIAARSFLARRIISFVRCGQIVSRGERVGKITFGSQVDIVLPGEAEILVKENTFVYAGKTPVARVVY